MGWTDDRDPRPLLPPPLPHWTPREMTSFPQGDRLYSHQDRLALEHVYLQIGALGQPCVGFPALIREDD